MADDDRVVANFLFEAGTLKNHKRTGWWIAGVKDPESVAEHSWRAALLASIIAEMEGADPARAALLSVWHDTGESRTGDLAPEAICAGDADKLECLVQAVEYRDQGHANAERWIVNSQKRMRTESAKRIAAELLGTGSLGWLRKAMGES
ncbi:HAD family hydrolase [Embleya scabrispora]|uniref:5'-deoxynucleotidase n=1 Tax=Embleya scabrispora TaxID=159449 RepID=A0A1T3P3K5_9ACTN|nr:HD domain-containing protein [Embleya scabrispora]OPC83677.1 HAD family hydrolase [Embleya scabrispora]